MNKTEIILPDGKYLDGPGKLKCRKLWEECFPEDSKEFCDYYFREKLKDNRILAITSFSDTSSLQIESMVHLNPYRLAVRGRRWTVNYLVGVATQKEKRHRGYMRRLLLQTLTDMRREQTPFCFLMPANESIYQPFNFTYIFRQPCFSLKEGIRLRRRELSESSSWKEAALWMEQWMSRHYDVYAQRDEAYLRCLSMELASEEGSLDVLYDGNSMVGFFGQWGKQRKTQRLLYCASSYVEEVCPPKPAIMARIITPEIFVQAIRLRKGPNSENKEIVIPLHLTDSLIKENHGNWLWHLNQETSWIERASSSQFANEAESARFSSNNTAPLALTIEEFTQWLFGYHTPDAAKPFAQLVEPLQKVFLDEIV